MRPDDFVITVAYFSIPIQILASLWKYPRLASMPISILCLLILFALFIFLCGAGHLLRCMDQTQGTSFAILNICTAIISLTTALYLLPLIPSLMSTMDDGIQDLKRLNAETIERKQQLLTFMSFLCHEIRNPLFAITSNLSFLEDDADDLTPEQSNAIASIGQSTKLMLRLVNDVLDLRKIESGKLELEDHAFDVKELFSHVVASTEMQVHKQHEQQDENGNSVAKAVVFEHDISPSIPRIISADSVRILQIVYNLLSNACKFTERGSIQLRVSTIDYEHAMKTGLIPRPKKTRQQQQRAPGLMGHDESNSSTSTTHNTNLEGTPRLSRLLPSLTLPWFQKNDSLTQDSIAREGNLSDTEKGSLLSSSDKRGSSTSLSHDGDTKKYDVFILPPHESSSVRKDSVNQDDACDSVRELDPEKDQIIVLKVEVSDTGPGISPERMGLIFQPYTQSKLSDYRLHGGTGLGLSILLRLSRQMGGDTCAVSQVKVGSTFVSYLPVVVPRADLDHDATGTNISVVQTAHMSDLLARDVLHLEDTMSGSNLSSNGESNKKSTSDSFTEPKKAPSLGKFDFPKNNFVILIVDDNNLNRRLIGRMLSHFNLEYREASNGQEAVDAIMQSRNVTPTDYAAPYYSLILMDLCMPVMGGVEATSVLRRLNQCEIPIVALTANAAHDAREEAISAGCNEFFTKPFLREQLHRTCSKYLLHNEASTLTPSIV